MNILKNRSSVVLMVVTFFLILLSCQTQEHGPPAAKMEMEESIPQADEEANQEIERKLIKEGWVRFEVKDLEETQAKITAAVSEYKGYLASDEQFKESRRITTTMVVRVPADNFDGLLEAVSQGVDRFDSKDIRVKDVTEEFLDVEARLKSKKELESRYLTLLQQAQTVTEMLEIEKQINLLRTEIESVEGRLKYLTNQISFSTLTITFYEIVPVRTAFGQEFKNGFRNGWNNLIWFFVGLVNIWPFLLLIAGMIWGGIWWKRRKAR